MKSDPVIDNVMVDFAPGLRLGDAIDVLNTRAPTRWALPTPWGFLYLRARWLFVGWLPRRERYRIREIDHIAKSYGAQTRLTIQAGRCAS